MRDMTGRVLFTKKNTLGFYGFIETSKGETFYFDTSCVVKGYRAKAGDTVTFMVRRLNNGKKKAVDVAPFTGQRLDETLKADAQALICTQIEEKGAINCVDVPPLLEKVGIAYGAYSKDLDTFIKQEFDGVFRIRKNVPVSGGEASDFLVEEASGISEEEQIEKFSEVVSANPTALEKLEALLNDGNYRGFLHSKEFRSLAPNQLNVKGVTMAIRAVAGYLGDDTNIVLSEFQKTLIKAERAADLIPLRDDETVLMEGMSSSFEIVSVSTFQERFSSVCHGKNNLNNNWNGLVERFWGVKNELAFYINALWLFSLGKERCIEFYLEEGVKSKKIDRIADLLYIWKSISVQSHFVVPLGLKRKILGHCLDCDDIGALCKAIALFDDITMPEAKQLPAYLKWEKELTGETLMSLFHSDIAEQASQKLVNYFWYYMAENEKLPEEIIKTLSSICWEYSAEYLDVILYNSTYPDFGIVQKAKILLEGMPELCEFVRRYKKSYVLVNYIYNYLVERYAYAAQLPREKYDEMWQSLKTWMKDQVTSQFSDNLMTSKMIAVFKFDDATTYELQNLYCDLFVKPEIEGITVDEKLDELMNHYQAAGYPFIQQWIISHYRDVAGQNINHLLQKQKFSEAIRWVQSQDTFTVDRKKNLLKRIICENFKVNGFEDSAYDIYTSGIPVAFAESLLLDGFLLNEIEIVRALFATYIHQKDWLKVAFLYAPCNALHVNVHPQMYEYIKSVLGSNGIDATRKAVNHLEVVKTALKVLPNEEFDAFIDWAKKIKVPYSTRRYEIKPQTFDSSLKSMLSDVDYAECWNQLLYQALRTDNAELQDMLRYSIIVAYIGRFGQKQFESCIDTILKWKNPMKDYYGYYTSIWKGLYSGKYSTNMLAQNLPLIREAPTTYWNLFYDVAVCRNHVFTQHNLWGAHWRKTSCDMQAFYNSLLERYSENREPIFIQLAAKLLDECEQTLSPKFDKYLPYCNSNKPKEFLFNAMIHLLKQKRYLKEIEAFLKSGTWFLTESERRLSEVLELICEGDHRKINDRLGMTLDEYWLEYFISDFLSAFEEYPKMDVARVLEGAERTDQYRFALIRHVFHISFNQPQMIVLEKRGIIRAPRIDRDDPGTVRGYIELMETCYKRQLQTGVPENIRWVQNRYHRILAAGMILERYSDGAINENVVTLMQSHKHFSDIYSNYKEFKDALFLLLQSERLTDYQRDMLCLCVISNVWEEFLDHIETFSPVDLGFVHTFLRCTNYRELNLQILDRYILLREGEYTDRDIALIRSCAPRSGYVLAELLKIRAENAERYDTVVTVLRSICRLKQQNRPSISYEKLDYNLEKNHALLHENWDLFMAAVLATNYESTIVILLGQDVRNVKKRCTLKKLELWEPVFRSMSQMSAYYYLLAVWYAMNKNKDEARNAYSKIIAFKDLPVQWTAERKDLEAYMDGKAKRFFASYDKHASSIGVETEAKNLDFITTVVGTATVSNEDAVSAYKTIWTSTNKTKQLAAYKTLFSFVHNPDNLYEVFRQIDWRKEKLERLTYNELALGFASLLVTEEAELFSHDEKYGILSGMVDIYELLSDFNKEKNTVKDQLKAAESYVFGTPGLGMTVWVNHFDCIRRIMSHPAIGSPESLIEDLAVPVEQCRRQIAKFETQMQILEWLVDWRDNWNVSSNCSDYERAFFKSVDDEIYRLRHGANLKLIVLNDTIEDDCIFYQVENIAGKTNTTIMLNNGSDDSAARLEVLIGVNGAAPESYDNSGFDSIIELRPGDVCGQVYRLHSGVLSKLKPGDRLEVILNIVIGGVVICNNGVDRLFTYDTVDGILGSDIVSDSIKYETAVPAFTRMIKGFGREKEKKLIREYLDQNLVVIYGPSRVGKSSLMNYINNEYIETYCARPEHEETAVLSIMIAGEDSSNDYKVNILDPSESIEGYGAKQMMEYLFITPLLSAFDPMEQDSRCEYFGREFPVQVQERILTVLKRSGTIGSKYKAISRILEESKCEIWLLFDEFQQTIDRLDGAASELARLCSSIKFNLSGIKAVLCGSDDLLRLFECKDDPRWNEFKIKTSESSVPVGQLEYDDFVEMMEDPRVWSKLGGIKPFSEAALKLLHRYTGGNAICGKIFGNEVLQNLHKGLYRNRRQIYPSDITRIAYLLLSNEVSLVKSLLVAHNTKNLDNEMRYLLFIANELANDTNHAHVAYRKIREFFVSRSTAEIELALKILNARGILTNNRKETYRFTTMFYYDFFKSQATETRIQEIYDAEHLGSQNTKADIESDVDERLLSFFKGLSPDRQSYMIGGLLPNVHPDARSNVQKTIGTWYQIGGSVIQEQNIQINAQTINTTFNVLLTADANTEGFFDAIRKMPTLSAYLSESQKNELQELIVELKNCDNDLDAMDTGMRIEAVTMPVEQQMLRDTVGAVVACDDFVTVTDQRWMELLGIPAKADLQKIRALPTEIVTPLSFAVMLHNVFDKISQKVQTGAAEHELDFSPVAIMYCKAVEAILKKLHTPVYIDKIGNRTVSARGTRFQDLLEPDGVTIRYSRDLTIGSFSHPIVEIRRENDVNDPEHFVATPIKSIIRCLTGVRDDKAPANQMWAKHAKELAVIQAIRNKSAHEVAPISKTNFEWLVQVLFKNGELLRIEELSNEK